MPPVADDDRADVGVGHERRDVRCAADGGGACSEIVDDERAAVGGLGAGLEIDRARAAVDRLTRALVAARADDARIVSEVGRGVRELDGDAAPGGKLIGSRRGYHARSAVGVDMAGAGDRSRRDPDAPAGRAPEGAADRAAGGDRSVVEERSVDVQADDAAPGLAVDSA